MIYFKLGVEPGLRYVSSLVLSLDCDTFQFGVEPVAIYFKLGVEPGLRYIWC